MYAKLFVSPQATIMTDPGTADRTYIGPMTPEMVEKIIIKVSCSMWLFYEAYAVTFQGETTLEAALRVVNPCSS